MNKRHIKWPLFFYDAIIFLAIDALLLWLYGGEVKPTFIGLMHHAILSFISVMTMRFIFGIYSEIWRYGSIEIYIKLVISDALAFWLYFILAKALPIQQITFVKMIALVTMNLLSSLCLRMCYRYAYKCATPSTAYGRFLSVLLKIFAGIKDNRAVENRNVKVAIYGAGSLGVQLFEDIYINKQYPYEVRCFIDGDLGKRGRSINGVKVIGEEEASAESLIRDYSIQEVFFAIHNLDQKKMETLYTEYTKAGLKVKNYDVPHVLNPDNKGTLKDIEIEDLLFRKPVVIEDKSMALYYKDKTILITGGGGSIGSELCRQVASFKPKKLIVLDIYENSAYELQQEMKMHYKNALDFEVEICSITNKEALRRVFEKEKIDIVINAAAHKHVPLMEHNAIEAIENNVFGCKNLLDLTEEYGVKRFMMVSTDKAVNPTNVMGATKRLCEMMVLSQSKWGKAVYSCTRFGNVLGSAGSVIPLFKKQIKAGGPVTLTDKRIIRYFMTIPEASELVLESGAMAKNGELFVLDMGKPVKILDLAENMIRLSGAKNIEIIETGLRPGEKLYEELLVDTTKMEKTDNNLIFVEHDEPIAKERIEEKLNTLNKACEDNLSNVQIRQLLRSVVPTFREPSEVNQGSVL